MLPIIESEVDGHFEYKPRANGHEVRQDAIWQGRYDKLVDFVDKNKKLPSKHSDD